MIWPLILFHKCIRYCKYCDIQCILVKLPHNPPFATNIEILCICLVPFQLCKSRKKPLINSHLKHCTTYGVPKFKQSYKCTILFCQRYIGFYEYFNNMKLHQITIPYVVIKIGNTYETKF